MNAYRFASILRTFLQFSRTHRRHHPDASPHISLHQGQLTPWSTLYVNLSRIPNPADKLQIAQALKDRDVDILRINSSFGSFTGDAAKAAQYFKALAEATEPKPG
jgi:hypothetical protein